MTLAFINSDDKSSNEDGGDFCTASMSREQLQAKIPHHIKLLNLLTDAELQAAMGEDDENDIDMDEEDDEDKLEERQIAQPQTKTSSV